MIIFLSGSELVHCRAHPGGQRRKREDPVTGRSQELSAPSENKRTAVESAEETAHDALQQRNRTNNYETDS